MTELRSSGVHFILAITRLAQIFVIVWLDPELLNVQDRLEFSVFRYKVSIAGNHLNESVSN